MRARIYQLVLACIDADIRPLLGFCFQIVRRSYSRVCLFVFSFALSSGMVSAIVGAMIDRIWDMVL